MSGHSPGPWLIDGRTVYALTDSPKGKVKRFFCFIQSARQPFEAQLDELAANASLISAAPDLLAALQAIRVLAPPGSMFRVDAESAIAKATQP